MSGPQEVLGTLPQTVPNGPHAPISAEPMATIKEWHQTVGIELRSHLVHKLQVYTSKIQKMRSDLIKLFILTFLITLCIYQMMKPKTLENQILQKTHLEKWLLL